jgi:asparagine synthase (glutamine-hydrolysing)
LTAQANSRGHSSLFHPRRAIAVTARPLRIQIAAISMKHEFSLTLRLSDSSGKPVLEVIGSHGASLGHSDDGDVTVAILADPHAADSATRWAQAWSGTSGDPVTLLAPTAAGALAIHRRELEAHAVAPKIGLRQIYWRAVGNVLAFASSPRLLKGLPGDSLSVRPDALFRYLYFHVLPGPDSFFDGVSKLDAGHALRWNTTGVTVTRYWHPRFTDTVGQPERAAAVELHSLLDSAVKKSLGDRDDAGAFLSGGLDSSTVAGLAAGNRPGIPTVSMGFHASGYDEMAYARIASRHFSTRPLEYYVTPEDVLATLPDLAAAFPEPFGNSSAAAVYHCARVARENGIGLLLAGDGGDELFGGNERYARQLTFERYGGAPRFLRLALERSVGAAAALTQAFPIGKISSYLQQANTPLPDRLQSYNFLHRHDPAQVFVPELLETVDQSAPLRQLREEYAAPLTQSAVNRMLFLDWKFTLHDNDLVKVNTMCQFADVDVVYPMLDPAVVEFSMQVPGDWKVRNGELRWFYKRAMRDFLPREIVDKTKHGFGLPFGIWTRTHKGLGKLSGDSLGSLATRGYFRRDFLLEAMRLHREGHASYYGELVWVLMTLELWLQAHAPDARI